MKKPSQDQYFSDSRRRLFELLLKDGGIDLPPHTEISKRDTSKPCRLTITQERLWKEWRTGQMNQSPNHALLLHLKGRPDILALTQSINEVVNRHEILRTKFIEVDGEPHQYVSSEMKLETFIADLIRVSPREKEAVCMRLSTEQVSRGFDLQQLPLLRFSIIVLSPHEHVLIVTLHQIICDAWSKNILAAEMDRSYGAYITGGNHTLKELPIQFCDFAMWQTEHLEADGMSQRGINWRRQSREALAFVRPAPDASLPSPQRHERAGCNIILSDAAAQQVKQIARIQGLTSYMILLAAWYALLSQYNDQEQVAVGTVMANRDREELQSLIGPVSNILLMKVDLRDNPSFKDVMMRVKETVMDAFEHQHIPYEFIASETAGPDEPLPGVMFVMDEGPGDDLVFGGMKAVEVKLECNTGNSDLAIFMQPTCEGFKGRIEYSKALFDDERIMRMTARYERLIEIALSDINCPVRNLPPIDG